MYEIPHLAEKREAYEGRCDASSCATVALVLLSPLRGSSCSILPHGHDALPCLHLAVISGLLHLAVPVTRCCFSCRQSIGYAIKRPHHLRTMSRAISRTHQVFSAALGHASDALLTLFANQFNAQTAPVPGALWHPPAGIRPAMMMVMGGLQNILLFSH